MLDEQEARDLLLDRVLLLDRFRLGRRARLRFRPPPMRRARLQTDVPPKPTGGLNIDAHHGLEEAPPIDRELLALRVGRRESVAALEHLGTGLSAQARVPVDEAAAGFERVELGRIDLGDAEDVAGGASGLAASDSRESEGATH